MDTRVSSEDRRAQIIEGAFKVLIQKGLPHLSYDQVAEASGTTRQLVRYHFQDPEALMLEVCERLAAAYREGLLSLASNMQSTARVDVFLDFYFDLIEGTAKPRDDQVYDAIMSLAAGSEKLRAHLGGQYQLLGQVLSHEFAVQYPELDQQGADELSYLFVCLMYGHWKMVASLGYAEHHKHITRAAMDRLIRSYRNHPPDTSNGKAWAREEG